ncbi:MAG: hypothetical protein Q9228_004238 [Teloschistes exilis]
MPSSTLSDHIRFTFSATARHTHTIILLRGSPHSGLQEDLPFYCDPGMPSFPLHFHLPACKFLIPDDLATLAASTTTNDLTSLVATEAQDVGPGRVILLGLNGGWATAVQALLASVAGRGEVGAVVAVSGWLPFAREVQAGYRGEGGPLSVFSHAGSSRDAAKAAGGKGDEGFSITEFYERNLGVELTGKVSNGKSSKCGKGKNGVPGLIAQCANRAVVWRGLGLQMEKVLGDLGMNVDYKEYTRGGSWLCKSDGIKCVVDFLERKFRLPTR